MKTRRITVLVMALTLVVSGCSASVTKTETGTTAATVAQTTSVTKPTTTVAIATKAPVTKPPITAAPATKPLTPVGSATNASTVPPSTKPPVTKAPDYDAEREWFEEYAQAVDRSELGSKVESSYMGKWIKITPKNGFMGTMALYQIDAEVRGMWDELVGFYKDVSSNIANQYKGYTIELVDPINAGEVLLSVTDGRITYDKYADMDIIEEL